jgi:glucose-6-phosphate 1-dehydrogenase
VIRGLVLFGATGDLAARYVLPALAALHAAGDLPDGFQLVGAARLDLDDGSFRRRVSAAIDEFGGDIHRESREALVRSARYRRVDLADHASVARATTAGKTDGPIAAYLALPPAVLPTAIASLAEATLPEGSRVAIEKPFGENRDGAIALNALLAEASGERGEQAVFRVDHVLGMATLQNLVRLRLANRVLDALWHSQHIQSVDILWEETIALEGRAGYYDKVGALKDVLQNHMLQVLSLVAMEPPSTLGERDLRDAKVKVLRAVRPPSRTAMAQASRRARYAAGRLAGDCGAADRAVPSYTDESGVDPARNTETLAEVELTIDTPRWSGTKFVLRAGKALERRRKGVVVTLRPVDHPPFDSTGRQPGRNQLWVGLDGPDHISLGLEGGPADTDSEQVHVVLQADPPASTLPAYGHVLLDILSGGSRLSVRGDEAEEAWRIVEPVLRAWRDGEVPMEEYAAGSPGPARRGT